jgi:hypothetical protein
VSSNDDGSGLVWLEAIARDPDTTDTDLSVAIAFLEYGRANGLSARCAGCRVSHPIPQPVVDATIDALTALGYVAVAAHLPASDDPEGGEFLLSLTLPGAGVRL